MNGRHFRHYCIILALVLAFLIVMPLAASANSTLTGRYTIPVRVYTLEGTLLGAGGNAVMTFPTYEGLVSGYFMKGDIQVVEVPTTFRINNQTMTIKDDYNVRLWDAYNEIFENLGTGTDLRGNLITLEKGEGYNKYTVSYQVRTPITHNLNDPFLWLAEQALYKSTSGGDLAYGFEVRVVLNVTDSDIVNAITDNGQKLDSILEAVTDTTASQEAADDLPNPADIISSATLTGANEAAIRSLSNITNYEIDSMPELNWIDESSNYYILLIVPFAISALFAIIFYIKRKMGD